MKLPLLAVAALVGLAPPSLHAQCRKPISVIFPADVSPVFEFLENRGIATGALRELAGCVEVFYRPMPAEAAAQYIPWVGFDNIHIPFSMRGADGRKVKIGTGPGESLSTVSTIVHELAHAEYDAFARKKKKRAQTPRLERLYRDVLELRRIVAQKPGYQTWPWVRAQEMMAYYLEDSLWTSFERMESVFTANIINVHRLIHSRADRERLRGTLVVDPTDGNVYGRDPTQLGGQRESAFFQGEAIDAEVPPEMRRRLYVDLLDLRLPKDGDEFLARARALDTPWKREWMVKIEAARDRRLAKIEAEARAAEPTFADLGTAIAETGEEESLAADAALRAKVAREGRTHHPIRPEAALAWFEAVRPEE